MPKIISFKTAYSISPNGWQVISYAAGDIVEVDDAIADQAIEDGAAVEMTADDLAKARAAYDKLQKAAEKAEAVADKAESDAAAARIAATEARAKASAARVGGVTEQESGGA